MAGFDYHGEGVLSKPLSGGRRSFYIQYRFEGRKITKSVGKTRKTTAPDGRAAEEAEWIAKARGLVAARLEERDDGKVPRDVAKKAERRRAIAASSTGPRVKDLAAVYARECVPLRRRPKWQKWMLETVSAELGAETPLAKVTPERMEAWRDKLAKEGKTPSTIRKYLYFASGVFSGCLRTPAGRRLVSDNPCRLVLLPSESRGLKKALDERQAADLLVSARNDEAIYRWASLMLYTGMRTEEAMRLEWRDVDVATGRLAIHDSKTGEPRYPEAGEHLLPELQAWHKADDPAAGDLVVGEAFARIYYERWQPIFKAAGIPWGLGRGEFTPRNLRTTFCMLAFQNGARPEELVQQTGHSLVTLFKFYAEASRDQRLRAVNAMPNLRRLALRAV